MKTIDEVAEDVHQKHLRISTQDVDRAQDPLEVCFINSKGFGGNNASAVVLGPQPVERMLRKRHGEQRFAEYADRRETVRAAALAYEQRALQGQLDVIYNFGQDMIDDHQIEISLDRMTIPGFDQPLLFRKDDRFTDMLD